MRHVEDGLFPYAPDGGYIDSTQYWHIGTRYLYYMMSTLDAAAGTNYGLFYSPGFAQSAFMPTYMENAAGTWMYHDPSGNARFVNTEVLPWFAKKLHDPRIGYLRRRSLEQTPSFHAPAPELLWHDSDLVANSINIPYDAHYDFLGTMVMHSSWEKNSIMTGIHGGINSRGSDHGDWDIGNFIIFSGEQQFLIELGIDSYSITNYFGKDRQKLYRKRAEGQNTLVIGDVSQDEPDQISGAFSPLLRTESNDRSAIGIIDMAPAYEQVTEGKRGLFFKDNRSVVVVQDEMKLSSSEIVRWSAHTMHTIDIAADGRSATLCTNDKDGKPLPCLYAEIVSSNNTLKFTSGDAQSFVPNYTKLEHELSLDGIHKLMIITDKKVNTLNLAVVFKVIQPDEKVSSGTIYQWTNMAQWKLQ
jgi:hypothetical protein